MLRSLTRWLARWLLRLELALLWDRASVSAAPRPHPPVADLDIEDARREARRHRAIVSLLEKEVALEMHRDR